MPAEERTMPSSRRVLTCKPALPGGRFLPAFWSFWRLTSDSNGSRREPLSPSPCGPDASATWGEAPAAGFGLPTVVLADLDLLADGLDFDVFGLDAALAGGLV